MLPYVVIRLLLDLRSHCAERDSPRDQLVVTLFLLTVFGLLLGAGIKSRMAKAGLNGDWNAGRRWWEVGGAFSGFWGSSLSISQAWIPRQQTYELGASRFGYSADRDIQMGTYIGSG